MGVFGRRSQPACFETCYPAAPGWCLFLASCVMAAGLVLSPARAQTPNQTDRAPSGWFLAGSKPASYRTGVDKAAIHDGLPSAYLQSAVPETGGFGTLMQSINAAEFAGKRVRLRAWVKSQDVSEWAGLWMRVDKGQTMAAFDNMQGRPIKATQGWQTYDVVLDVPEDATGISLGVLLSGAGEVWMNHVAFEAVGKEEPLTSPGPGQTPSLPVRPVNLNFSD
jgi:hypothetical protein